MSYENGICGCQECVNSYLQNYEGCCSSKIGCQEFSNYSEDADADVAGYLNDSPPVDQFLNENLHLVWFGHFQRRFSELQMTHNHIWILEPALNDDEITMGNNKEFQGRQLAKVRFICEDCGKTWTSMRGIALFSVLQVSQNMFVLRYSLYGQKCSNRACSQGGFQNAIWYPEEVIKVIDSIFHEVQQKFYGISSPNGSGQTRRVGLRLGRPLHSHDSANCQACQKKICPVSRRYATNKRTTGPSVADHERNRLISSGSRQREDSFSSGISSLAATSVSECDAYSACESPDNSYGAVKSTDCDGVASCTTLSNRIVSTSEPVNYGREMC